MNTSAFSALYAKYAPDVFRFALYLSGNRAEAEDIVSETFVRAWNAPGRIEAATVKAYLFTIARNLFLQGLRNKSRHVAIDERLADPGANPHARPRPGRRCKAYWPACRNCPKRTAPPCSCGRSTPYLMKKSPGPSVSPSRQRR